MILYLSSIVVLFVLFALSGLALNMQWGLAGLINFGLFGFYMLAAYVTALLAAAGLSPLLAMGAAIAMAAAVSAAVGQVAIRLSDDYLAIVTLGFAECLRLLITNEEWLTGGSMGISNIKRPLRETFAGLSSDVVLLVLSTACLVAVFVVYQLILRSPFGRTLRGIRDDPLVMESLGKPVNRIRIKAFAIGGAILGVAGSLHGFYYTYIDPTQFTTVITAFAFVSVLLGGRASGWGSLIGSLVVVVLFEGSRFANDYFALFDPQSLASLRMIVIGVVLIAIIRFRPSGLLEEFRLRVEPKRNDHPRSFSRVATLEMPLSPESGGRGGAD